MRIGNLQQIPVAGYQGYLQPLRLGFFRQRPQNIVSLQALLLHNNYPHSPEYILHYRHLLSQFLRHGFSGSLVRLVHLMAESRSMHVKCHRKVIRFFFFQKAKHNIQKSVNRIGMKPLGIGQVLHAVKCPVQDAVPVYQYKFPILCHIFTAFFT